MAIRIQRRRAKGWKMHENTVSVCRPGEWGNPFRIGGWFKVGSGSGRFMEMAWCQACSEEYADDTFTKIETAQQAVEFFAEYAKKYPFKNIGELTGKNLACWCPLDQPCHADVLLELANARLASDNGGRENG